MIDQSTKTFFYVYLTLVKVVLIIFFTARMVIFLVRRNDPDKVRKAVVQGLILFGFLIGLTMLEFGIALLL